jgi:isopenicillin-N epimerase
LPDGEGRSSHDLFPFDELQEELFRDYRIEVPVIAWPAPPKRLIRISAQLYNQEEQYAYLATALRELVS